jgi:hypothetical protein
MHDLQRRQQCLRNAASIGKLGGPCHTRSTDQNADKQRRQKDEESSAAIQNLLAAIGGVRRRHGGSFRVVAAHPSR